MSGNTSVIGDVGESPGKSYLFFLTVQWTLESDCPAIGCISWESGVIFAPSGALLTALENPVACIRTPGRTHNRLRSPRCAASSR